jgi:hypothetical protein
VLRPWAASSLNNAVVRHLSKRMPALSLTLPLLQGVYAYPACMDCSFCTGCTHSLPTRKQGASADKCSTYDSLISLWRESSTFSAVIAMAGFHCHVYQNGWVPLLAMIKYWMHCRGEWHR